MSAAKKTIDASVDGGLTPPAHSLRRRGFLPPAERRKGWWTGVSLLIVAAVCLVVNVRLPILAFGASGGATTDAAWSDLWNPDGLLYEQVLLVLPIAGSILAASAGFLLVTTAYAHYDGGLAASSRRASSWLVSIGGFLLVLAAARWIGFVVARTMDSGQAIVRAGPVPVVDAIVGLTLLAFGGWRLLRTGRPASRPGSSGRWDLLLAAEAAAALVFIPLVPLARFTAWGGGRVWIDELTLALMGTGAGAAAPPAVTSMAWVRGALWAALALAVVSAIAVSWHSARGGRPALQRPLWWAQVLVWFANVWMCFAFAQEVSGLQSGATLVFNPGLFLQAPVLGVTLLLYGRRLLRTRSEVVAAPAPSS